MVVTLISVHSQVHNQDDCLAINKGSNIVFKGNSCTGGHGISIVCSLIAIPSGQSK